VYSGSFSLPRNPPNPKVHGDVQRTIAYTISGFTVVPSTCKPLAYQSPAVNDEQTLCQLYDITIELITNGIWNNTNYEAGFVAKIE